VLKELIPLESRVESYFMFGGAVELSLAASKRHVIAHLNRRPVYDFWKCLEVDSSIVVDMVRSFNPLPDKTTFYLFQEKWHTYPDPFMRAALLLVLNRHTEEGTVSHGEFTKSRLNSLTLSYLTKLDFSHLELKLREERDLLQTISPQNAEPPSIVLINGGQFYYSYFPESKLRGPEETIIDHLELKTTLDALTRPALLLYQYDPRLIELYQEYTIHLVDGHGRRTQDAKFAQEVIIANF